MPSISVPRDIAALFSTTADGEALFTALMPAICRAMDCHRCLLFPRHPETWQSCCSHGWWDKPEHAFDRDKSWRQSPRSLATTDPMFGEALRNPVALYIDDIATAGPAVLNYEYERDEFLHRALIHAPLFDGGQCWGILEPCVFDAPRRWTAADRALTEWLQSRLAPLVAAYVRERAPR